MAIPESKFHKSDIPSTVGTYIGRRMLDVGVKDYFVVPGDFNLILLDEILRFPELRLISCCNELNAGYAADGYARANGVAVIFTTFTVGSLSAINAIAGAYSQDLPVILIAGAPNALDYGSDRVLHHSTGASDRSQELRCFEQVTAEAVEIRDPWQAPALIDSAFSTAMTAKKPVFISIACNVAKASVPLPIPSFIPPLRASSPQSLQSALEAVTGLWEKSVNPVIVTGIKTKPCQAQESLLQLAEAAGCGVAIMPEAKGLFPETHPHFLGLWWGPASSPNTAEVVDSADLQLLVGPVFDDISSVGYSCLPKWDSMVQIGWDRVKTPDADFGCVYMAEFLRELSTRLKAKDTTLSTYKSLKAHVHEAVYTANKNGAPLTTRNIDHQVQSLLKAETALLVETGDSWFHGQRMNLPEGCLCEFQMQYCSVGWSVGALLGYAMALDGKKRVIAMIGDGSFQMTAQEVSTMIRYDLNPIIFLINNKGYTILVELHDGIYNIIKNWDYKGLIDVFSAGEGRAKSWRAATEEELVKAVEEAKGYDGLAFIECVTDEHDCAKELLKWGPKYALASGRQKDV